MPRLPAHFKLYATLRSDPRFVSIAGDNDLLATWARIGLRAIECYADRNHDSFLALGADLEWLTGCRGTANARRRLGRLEAVGLLRVSREGAAWRLTLPNFAKDQFNRSTNGPDPVPPTTTATTTTTTTPTEETGRRKRGRQQRLPVATSRREPNAIPPWALWVAGLLAQKVRERRQGAPVPDSLDGWAREIVRIEADPGTVADVVRWLYSISNEGQYRLEVQSGAALREKFGKALAAIERERSGSDRSARASGSAPLVLPRSTGSREESGPQSGGRVAARRGVTQ